MTNQSRLRGINRRTLLKVTAASGAVAATGIAAPAIAQTKPIKLGYVSPQTGPLAAFAEADNFIIGNFREITKAGIKVGGATVPVEVVVKDSQSNPNRAAEVAKDLIVQDKIDLMLVASTPETTNPVSTQCEIEEVACVSTVALAAVVVVKRAAPDLADFALVFYLVVFYLAALAIETAILLAKIEPAAGRPNPTLPEAV